MRVNIRKYCTYKILVSSAKVMSAITVKENSISNTCNLIDYRSLKIEMTKSVGEIHVKYINKQIHNNQKLYRKMCEQTSRLNFIYDVKRTKSEITENIQES